MKPRASIVVLVHGQLATTRACLDSVLRTTDPRETEIVVVDNASPDATPKYLRTLARDHKNVRVVTNKSNLGFAAGNNRGIAVATGRTVCLLNNDTIVTDGWLARLGAVLDSDPAVGAVGPVTGRASGLQDLGDEHYTTPTGLRLWARYIARIHRYQMQQVEPPQRLVGFCVLVKRDVLDRIGRLDESYRWNFEDDDLAVRMRLAGYRQVIARDVWIHHEGSKTFEATNANYQQLMDEGRRIFIEKWQKGA